MKRSGHRGRWDETMAAVVIVLLLAGLVLLYSTSAYNGRVKFHDEWYYLKKQGFATLIGLLGMVFVARIDYHRWAVLAVPGYLAAVALSVAVMLFGDEYNGSKDGCLWARFHSAVGIRQGGGDHIPCMADQQACRPSRPVPPSAADACPGLPIAGLVGASNLSTAIIILGIAVVMIFVSSPKYSPFIWMGSAGAAFMAVFLAMESYRLERLAVWRDPEKYEKGYQTLQGLYAIGSRGVFGRGLGNSVQKLGFLPEAQNDMIFFPSSVRSWGLWEPGRSSFCSCC